MSTTHRLLKPFLKWPGGKRWLVAAHKHLLPTVISGRYIEPFVGGGALFFALRPERSILSDVVPDLITTYLTIKDNCNALLIALDKHSKLHSKEYYYKIRKYLPSEPIEQAAKFIYMNRTCFNGMYRVNKNGMFNVPIGTKTKVICEDDTFFEWSSALKNADIILSDFEMVIDNSYPGDFIFIDPPYTVHHNNNGFIKYNETLFSWQDQLRLFECVLRAKTRGVTILMTNANIKPLRDMYSKDFKCFVASRFSSIAASGAKRNHYEELIIQN